MSALEALVGTAVLVLPRGNLPLLAGFSAAKAGAALVRRARDRRRRAADGGGADTDADAEAAAAAAAAEQRLLLPLARSAQTSGAGGAGANGDAPPRPTTPAYDGAAVPPVTLEWSGVGYTLTTKKGEAKTILKGVRGRAEPGRLLAIM